MIKPVRQGFVVGLIAGCYDVETWRRLEKGKGAGRIATLNENPICYNT